MKDVITEREFNDLNTTTVYRYNVATGHTLQVARKCTQMRWEILILVQIRVNGSQQFILKYY